MSSVFQCHILGCDEVFYEGPCESLIIPTSEGQYGILPGHADMIAAVIPGEMLYRLPGEEVKRAAISPGLVKIEHGEVLVLCESTERPEDIDAHRAQLAADAAQEAILQKKSMQEYRSAQTNLARALNRLRVRSNYDSRR